MILSQKKTYAKEVKKIVIKKIEKKRWKKYVQEKENVQFLFLLSLAYYVTSKGGGDLIMKYKLCQSL